MNIVRNDLAKQVLDSKQCALTPVLEAFASTHVLAGGTGISLQIGHRKSIDFDLFCFAPQGTGKELMQRIKASGMMFDIDTAPRFWYSDDTIDELTLFFDGVKVQLIDFSRNPFDIPIYIQSEIMICGGMPSLSLHTLGAMKVYAMMYRKKAKDMIDIYFILQHTGLKFQDLVNRACTIFGKLYKPEYTYQSVCDPDRDHTETVEYIIPHPPTFADVHIYIQSCVDECL